MFSQGNNDDYNKNKVGELEREIINLKNKIASLESENQNFEREKSLKGYQDQSKDKKIDDLES